MAKKEKQQVFTEMVFDDAAYAMEIKNKCEQKLDKIKIGFIIAAVAEVMWLLSITIKNLPEALETIFIVLALGATVAAYIFGGGLLGALSVIWKIATTIGKIGWICVPFPADIFTGLILTFFALLFLPISLILLPIVVIFFNFIQVRKDYKAASEYLSYCKPATQSENE